MPWGLELDTEDPVYDPAGVRSGSGEAAMSTYIPPQSTWSPESLPGYPEGEFWVTPIRWPDGSMTWDKTPLDIAVDDPVLGHTVRAWGAANAPSPDSPHSVSLTGSGGVEAPPPAIKPPPVSQQAFSNVLETMISAEPSSAGTDPPVRPSVPLEGVGDDRTDIGFVARNWMDQAEIAEIVRDVKNTSKSVVGSTPDGGPPPPDQGGPPPPQQQAPPPQTPADAPVITTTTTDNGDGSPKVVVKETTGGEGKGGSTNGNGGSTNDEGGPPTLNDNAIPRDPAGTGQLEPHYKTFGPQKLKLREDGSGVTPGGGNPNEMYVWYLEAQSNGYPLFAELWDGDPGAAIARYNAWKREKIADPNFIVTEVDGRLMVTPRNADGSPDEENSGAKKFKTAIELRDKYEIEETARRTEAGEAVDSTGMLEQLRTEIERGKKPAFSIWEELKRTGMLGTPFEKDAESYLLGQYPQYLGQIGLQSARGQHPTDISDFLQQSYGRGNMSPEDLRMMISGQPGEGVIPNAFANLLDVFDTEDFKSNAFNLALGGSPFAQGPAAIRQSIATQADDYWNEYYQGTLSGDIEDVKGQADFLRYAANRMGIS